MRFKIRTDMVLRFTLAFAAISSLFTLLSWGQAEGHPFWMRPESGSSGLALHMFRHGLLGGLVALPTRRLDYVLCGALAAMLIDVDHLAWLGIPTVSRSSHSLGFLVLVVTSIAILARQGLLGRPIPVLLTSVVAGAAVGAHVALDVVETRALFPIWAPFSFELVGLKDTWWAVALFGLALLAVTAATYVEKRMAPAKRRAEAPGSPASTRI